MTNLTPELILAISAQLSLAILTLAALVAFVRIARGPGLADRVVALDFLTFVVVSIIGALAIYKNDARYLDVAIALALVAFLSTVALARYMERLVGQGEKPL